MEYSQSDKKTEYREVHPRNGLIYRFIKRFFDILFSLTFLLLLGWLILILVFIKFCEDGHNPIYTSIRVGRNGKLIKFHKIRTMKPNADKLKDQLIAEGKNEADGPVFKMKNDPRITKVGKVYRKLCFDEFPQVWDILVGRISIVGPRSPLPKEVEKYNEYQKHKLDVKGGLLCYWQVQKNRHDMSFDEWVELDIKYVETRSLWVDFKILIKGFFSFLFDHTGE